MSNMKVGINVLPNGEGLALPSYGSEDAAGLDLRAAIDADRPIYIGSGASKLVPCGISIALPKGYEAQIRPRSGLAFKNGVTVLNSPGTIDADYRGEIGALLINHGPDVFAIQRGDRIAQMVIAQYSKIDWEVAETLSDTVRGGGKFGSTGVK